MQKLEILQLKLIGFGKFREKEITLKPGLNLIEGKNEAGKSTIQAFLTGMFYGFYQPAAKRRSYTPHRDKYQPWDGGSYRGVLICRNEERTYRIERSFDKDNESVKVYDDLTGDDLTLDFPYHAVTRQPQIGETLLGLSKTAFNNTANIAQMSCSGVAQESGFSAEVNDKLLSLMKTADSNVSLSAVLRCLDEKAEQIGSPKKSKTPYGQAVLREKELSEELEESKKNESEYFHLLQKGKELRREIEQSEKEKKLLEAQVRESAAKELGGRYLKAQNLRTRIERIEKENEKYLSYRDIDLELIDQAQKRLGAKAQITRTLEKYRRALDELNRRTQELNNLYRTLEVSGADDEILEQFDLMFERHLNLETLRDELRELQIKKSNVSFHLSKLSAIDGEKLEEDIQSYRHLEEMKEQKKPDHSKSVGIGILSFGVLLLLTFATVIAFTAFPVFAGVSGMIVGLVCSIIGLFFIFRFEKSKQKGDSLEKIEEMQKDILESYQLLNLQNPLARLEEMLGRVQVNNYKVHQFEEQENILLEEITAKSQKANLLESEITSYLQKLTRRISQQEDTETDFDENSSESSGSATESESLSADEVRLKSLKESVNQAKRIRTDLQRLHLQQQQIMQEEENCANQIEQINQSIAYAVEACASSGAQTSDDLEKCRQGKRRYDEISVELKLQKELLEETLNGYTYEELENNVRSQRMGETEISADRQETCEKLDEVNAKLSELIKSEAELEGLRRGKEETQRPCGQIESDLQEVRQQIQRHQSNLDALEIAKEKLLSLSGQLHRDFAPQLNLKISQAIQKITNSRYTKAVIDQSLGIRLEEKKTGKLVEVSSLSNGMADLIYLILRLELLHLFATEGNQKVSVPVIFDDSFTQLDDERTARFLSFLLETQEEQILLFSCHNREKEMLTKAGIRFHLVSLKEETSQN